MNDQWTRVIADLAKKGQAGKLTGQALRSAATQLGVTTTHLVEQIAGATNLPGETGSWARYLVNNTRVARLAGQAGAQAGRSGLLSLAGRAVGGLLTVKTAAIVGGLVLLGAATYAAANYLGEKAGDDPVPPADVVVTRPSTTPFTGAASPTPSTAQAQGFYIVICETCGPSIDVMSVESVKSGTIKNCSLLHGGLCQEGHFGNNIAKLTIVGGGSYPTSSAARTAMCSKLSSIGPVPLAAGSQGMFEGRKVSIRTSCS